MTAEAAIAHFLLWFGKELYPSPEEAARALVQRLDHEGYQIILKSHRSHTIHERSELDARNARTDASDLA